MWKPSLRTLRLRSATLRVIGRVRAIAEPIGPALHVSKRRELKTLYESQSPIRSPLDVPCMENCPIWAEYFPVMFVPDIVYFMVPAIGGIPGAIWQLIFALKDVLSGFTSSGCLFVL